MKDIEKARQGLSDAETGGIATEGFTVPDMGNMHCFRAIPAGSA